MATALFYKLRLELELYAAERRVSLLNSGDSHLWRRLSVYRAAAREEALTTANEARALYKTLIRFGELGASICFAGAGRAAVENAACSYFLASCVSGGTYGDASALSSYRSRDDAVLANLNRIRPDVLILTDEGMSPSTLSRVSAGDYFIIGISSRAFSAANYDITCLIDSAAPESKQLFTELAVSALIRGLRKRAEKAALRRVSLLEEAWSLS